MKIFIGALLLCFGGVFAYYLNAGRVPPFLKPFVSTWWTKTGGETEMIWAGLLVIFSLLGGLLLIMVGLGEL